MHNAKARVRAALGSFLFLAAACSGTAAWGQSSNNDQDSYSKVVAADALHLRFRVGSGSPSSGAIQRRGGYEIFASVRSPLARAHSIRFALSQSRDPMSGTMQAFVPFSGPSSGVLGVRSSLVALRPDARETRFDAIYTVPITQRSRWFFGAALRHPAEYDPAVGPRQVTVGAGIRLGF